MRVGTQFTGTVPASGTSRWFTHSWPAEWHLLWTVLPTTPNPGAPQVSWDVVVERASATAITYWLTIRNLTAVEVGIEARYAVLND
jgi:hypothetical protein